MLPSGLFVVHDTLVGGEDEETELSGGENGVGKVLEVLQLEVESGGDNTALVESSVKLDNDLSGAGIIDDLELVDQDRVFNSSGGASESAGPRSSKSGTSG